MALLSPVIREHLEGVSRYATGRLLDVGCGNKPYRSVFPQVTHYVGMDRLSEFDRHREELSQRTASYDLQGDALDLPFAAGSFDTVLVTQALEHLADPRRLFGETGRVLKANGHLILTAPFVNPLHEEPYDFFRYTEHGLRALCATTGLEAVKIEGMGGGWLTIGYLLCHIFAANAAKARWRFLGGLWARTGVGAYHLLARLDRRNPHRDLPVNYLLVAKRI